MAAAPWRLPRNWGSFSYTGALFPTLGLFFLYCCSTLAAVAGAAPAPSHGAGASAGGCSSRGPDAAGGGGGASIAASVGPPPIVLCLSRCGDAPRGHGSAGGPPDSGCEAGDSASSSSSSGVAATKSTSCKFPWYHAHGKDLFCLPGRKLRKAVAVDSVFWCAPEPAVVAAAAETLLGPDSPRVRSQPESRCHLTPRAPHQPTPQMPRPAPPRTPSRPQSRKAGAGRTEEMHLR
jgi:hypothetical protein